MEYNGNGERREEHEENRGRYAGPKQYVTEGTRTHRGARNR